MHIQAAVARETSNPLAIEHLAVVEPGDDEIRVRLVACGVSSADADAVAGRFATPRPFVPGGEGTGIVEHVGANVRHLAPGDAVVMLAAHCGRCDPCRRGLTRACRHFAALNLEGRRDPDGGTSGLTEDGAVHGRFFGQSAFATHAICRAENALKVAPEAPLELLAAVCGSLSGAAAAVLQHADMRDDASVLVVGGDVAGLFACMVAKAHGFSLIIDADPDEARLQRAVACGATIVTDDLAGLETFVGGLTPEGADLVVFATSDDAPLAPALAALAPHGRLVSAALAPADPPPTPRSAAGDNDDPRITRAEVHLRPSELVATLVSLQAEGKLPIERIVAFYPFDRVNEALAALARDPHVKPVIRFSIGAFDDLDRAETAEVAREVSTTNEDVAPEREPVPTPVV